MDIEDQILKINPRKEIEQAASLEAMMTYLKTEANHPGVEAVWLYPDIVKDKSDLFYFAMIYGMTLSALNEKRREVPPEVRKMFESGNN